MSVPKLSLDRLKIAAVRHPGYRKADCNVQNSNLCSPDRVNHTWPAHPAEPAGQQRSTGRPIHQETGMYRQQILNLYNWSDGIC